MKFHPLTNQELQIALRVIGFACIPYLLLVFFVSWGAYAGSDPSQITYVDSSLACAKYVAMMFINIFASFIYAFWLVACIIAVGVPTTFWYKTHIKKWVKYFGFLVLLTTGSIVMNFFVCFVLFSLPLYFLCK